MTVIFGEKVKVFSNVSIIPRLIASFKISSVKNSHNIDKKIIFSGKQSCNKAVHRSLFNVDIKYPWKPIRKSNVFA